jgi:hypothetical protein
MKRLHLLTGTTVIATAAKSITPVTLASRVIGQVFGISVASCHHHLRRPRLHLILGQAISLTVALRKQGI